MCGESHLRFVILNMRKVKLKIAKWGRENSKGKGNSESQKSTAKINLGIYYACGLRCV